MAEIFKIGGINVLDGNNLAVRGSRNLGRAEWTDIGLCKKKSDIRTLDADRKDRSLDFTLVVTGATTDEIRANFDPLRIVLDRSYFELVFNEAVATEQNRALSCFNASYEVILPEENTTGSWLEWEIHISCNAKPYAYLTSVDLPKNYIVDAAMCDDFNADGLANSWEISTVGAGTAASSIVNGRQWLSLSDGDATSAVYLKQIGRAHV